VTTDTPIKKTPPRLAMKSVQMNLFSQFITNDRNEVSNTVDIWESIPKYFFTTRQQEKLRTETGHADPYKWEYVKDGQACTVKIQPALIEQEDGSYKAFFPSVTEEIIEESLKKLLTVQSHAMHDVKELETWVKFTLRCLYKELKARGRTRSIAEIKHSIEIMSSCIITFYHGKKEIWKGAILQDLVTVGRDEYIEDTDAHHVARLPLFISQSINSLEYRQFNYDRLLSCNEQLSRWIYKRLINRFRQASFMNDYHFLYSDLKNSGLLQQAIEGDNRKKVLSALDELKQKGVISRYEIDERKERRKIIEVKYLVFAASDFIGEQKAANKRFRENHLLALNAGVQIVHK